MDVFSIEIGWNYEGGDTFGVFSTKEKAESWLQSNGYARDPKKDDRWEPSPEVKEGVRGDYAYIHTFVLDSEVSI